MLTYWKRHGKPSEVPSVVIIIASGTTGTLTKILLNQTTQSHILRVVRRTPTSPVADAAA